MTDQVDKQNIFDKEEETVTTPAETSTAASDQTAKDDDFEKILTEKLSLIVDDKGEQKYRDPIVALDALQQSQQFIKTLQEENRTYRETLTQKETMEQARQNISATKEPETTKSEGIDAEKLREVTLDSIRQYEAEKMIKANIQSVSDKLIETFGDAEKAKAAYSEKAKQLGMTTDKLMDLAATSPKAVLEYFKVTETPNKPKASQGTINTQTLTGQSMESVDITARYFSSSDPAISKWREISGS